MYGKQYNFELVTDPTQRSGLKGLPPNIESRILAEFKKDEIMARPEEILKCILEAKMMKSGKFEIKLRERELPQYSESIKLMKEKNIFKRENPSEHYYIVKRLAAGGFAKVFLVKRIVDEKEFALKFLEPKNKGDYDNIKNEVAIMMLC